MSRIFIAFALSSLVISSALAFIPQPNKISRSLAILAAGCLLIYIQSALASSTRNRYPFAGLLTIHWYLLLRAACLLLLHPQSSVLFRRQLDGDQHEVLTTNGVERTDGFNALAIIHRLVKSLDDLWSFRTFPRAISNIPSFSNTDKSYVPSRVVFLTYEALKLVASWSILFLTDQKPPSQAEIEASFTSEHEKTLSRLADIRAEEIPIRIVVLVSAGASVWATTTLVRSTVAITSVSCGLTSPSSWPPLFGSLRESYTLRRFWSVTWHQIFRMPLEDASDFLTSRVLRIPKSTMFSLSSKLMFAFLLLGLAHYVGDIVQSAPVVDSGSLMFFILQPLGIMTEEAVQALYRRTSLRLTWGYWFGYIWVSLFLLWSGPGFAYPVARSWRNGVDFNAPHSMF